MIQLIYAKKGSGKTKRLIDLANADLNSTKGDVVFIDDDKRYMYDLRHEIRFVDASAYPVARGCSPDAFLAFISGMLAVNYDITLISIDAFLKLVHIDDPAELSPFFAALDKLSQEHNCNFMVSVSMEVEKFPKDVLAYVQ